MDFNELIKLPWKELCKELFANCNEMLSIEIIDYLREKYTGVQLAQIYIKLYNDYRYLIDKDDKRLLSYRMDDLWYSADEETLFIWEKKLNDK